MHLALEAWAAATRVSRAHFSIQGNPKQLAPFESVLTFSLALRAMQEDIPAIQFEKSCGREESKSALQHKTRMQIIAQHGLLSIGSPMACRRQTYMRDMPSGHGKNSPANPSSAESSMQHKKKRIL